MPPKVSVEKRDAGVNPKDLAGAQKVPLSLIPASALMTIAMAMQEGAVKYGPYNWRDQPIQMSIYIEASLGHLLSLQDGEDIDQDSGFHHAAKAAACCVIILDAIMCGCMIDNRPTIQRIHKGTFTRDPTRVLGIPERVKELLSKPWRKTSIGQKEK